MATNYPVRVDTDVEIATVRDNISEIGAGVINSIKSATIAIEKYVGTSTGSTLSLTARLNLVIDNDGRLRQSAIERAGFITGPITNTDVDANAAIVESKLSLNHSTNDLQDQIDVLRTRSDANTSQVLATATTVATHIDSNAVGAHLAVNISYDPTANTYYLTPSASPYFDADDDDVQTAIDRLTEVLRMHKEATVTSLVPFGEHYASAIYFDNDNVSQLTSAEDVQEALEDAFDLYNTNMVVHRDEQHANGIVRNISVLQARSTGFLYTNAALNISSFVAGSSTITFAGTTLFSSGLGNGDKVVISGSTEDDDTYYINEILSNTTLSILGTFKNSDGGSATASLYFTDFAESPVEWSCNCLNVVESPNSGFSTSTELLISHPGAAVVMGDEINFGDLSQQISAGNTIFRVRYNNGIYNGVAGTYVNIDITADGFVNDTGTYAQLMQTLTTQNIVRQINKTAKDNHYSFHAYVRDRNQIAIAHNWVNINSSNPQSTSLTDTIEVADGSGAGSINISYLGFSSAQIGVASPAYPILSNAFYVDGNRLLDVRCLTHNGAYDYILANLDRAADVLEDFTYADGTAIDPREVEMRIGDTVRIISSPTVAAFQDGDYTINTLSDTQATLRNGPGAGTTIPVRIYSYRNTVTAVDYDPTGGSGSNPSVSSLYRIGINENGDVFKKLRLTYDISGATTGGFNIVNCSKTLAGSADGATTYVFSIGDGVSDTFGTAGIYDPTNYYTIYSAVSQVNTNNLQFDLGEVKQVVNFDTNSFGRDIQTYRIYSVNHVDWIDVEVDFSVFNAATNKDITITVYPEMSEEKNLMLATALWAQDGAWRAGRFASVIDERYFGTTGDLQVRSDFKQDLWEAHRGIGNYILRGLLLTISDVGADNDLTWSGGSAFINGHRVDFEGGTFTKEFINEHGSSDRHAVYAFEGGDIILVEDEDGRPQEDCVLLGTFSHTAGEVQEIFPPPDYTNLNKKILITVSPDPSEGMFTTIENAVNYAQEIVSIQHKFHDYLLSSPPLGVQNIGATIYIKNGDYIIENAITLPTNVNLEGVGTPFIYIASTYNAAHIFSLTSQNRISGLMFYAVAAATVTNGMITIAGDQCSVRDCTFATASTSVVSDIYLDTADYIHIDHNLFSSSATHCINVLDSDYTNITNNTFSGGDGIYYRSTSSTHGALAISSNAFIGGDTVNLQILATDEIAGVIIDNNGFVISGGGTGKNISITDASHTTDVKITNCTFLCNGGANIKMTHDDITDFSITNCSFSNTNNNSNLYILNVGDVDGVYVSNSSFTTGTDINVVIALTDSSTGIRFDNCAFTAAQENLDIESNGAINDFYVTSCVLDTSATTLYNIKMINGAASYRWHFMDNYMDAGDGTTAVENILFALGANVNDIMISGNILNTSAETAGNITFDGRCDGLFIIGNKLLNQRAGLLATSHNISIGASGTTISTQVRIVGNFLYTTGGSTRASNIYIYVSSNIEDYTINDNIMETASTNVYLYTAANGKTLQKFNINGNVMEASAAACVYGNLLTGTFTRSSICDNVMNMTGSAPAIDFLDGVVSNVDYVNVCDNVISANVAGSTTGAIDLTNTSTVNINNNVFEGDTNSVNAIYLAGSFDRVNVVGNNADANYTKAIAWNAAATTPLEKLHAVDNFPLLSDLTFRAAMGTDVVSTFDDGGGGLLIGDLTIDQGETKVLDSTIDFTYKYIYCSGAWFAAANYIPGSANDIYIRTSYAAGTAISEMFYSNAGTATPTASFPLIESVGILADDGGGTAQDLIYIYADSGNNGRLTVYRGTSHGSGVAYNINIKIVYSPLITE